MSDTYELLCSGERVVIERIGDDVFFHNYNPEVDLAMEALGDDPSPCFIVWKALEDDTLDQDLSEYAFDGGPVLVGALLFAGADAEAKESEALVVALEAVNHVPKKNKPVIRLLLEAGADPDVTQGLCLRNAIASNDPEIVEMLLEYGADPELPGALVRAIHDNNEAIVALLIEHGADVEANENAALTTAANYGYTDIVDTLIASGAGQTVSLEEPLDAAATEGHADIVERLIAAGAYVAGIGNNALEYAILNAHHDVVVLLLENGVQLPDGAPEEAMYAYDHGNYEYAADVLIGEG